MDSMFFTIALKCKDSLCLCMGSLARIYPADWKLPTIVLKPEFSFSCYVLVLLSTVLGPTLLRFETAEWIFM